MDRTTLTFAREHIHDDTAQLLLASARYPDVDMRTAVQQIEGMRTAAAKWPSLLEYEEFAYPPRLNCEQSSSEATARYKAAQLVAEGAYVADLTGGMGVDTLWMASRAAKVTYLEQNASLCALMQHNLSATGCTNVHCETTDCMDWIEKHGDFFDLIYVDPARRDRHGHRVYALEDCTPDILQHKALIMSRCRKLAIKASPMIDVQQAIRQVDSVTDVYLIAVQGECKEIVLVCQPTEKTVTRHCVDIRADRTDVWRFTAEEEAAAEGHYCQAVGSYLYEPNAAIMKGGPFKLISQQLHVEQLDVNSHFYTSDRMVEGFPGRRFRVKGTVKLNRQAVKRAVPEGCGHVVSRNYPVDAARLQQQLGLREGGTRYLIATTAAGCKCGLLCERID